jgi:hypothetical protein
MPPAPRRAKRRAHHGLQSASGRPPAAKWRCTRAGRRKPAPGARPDRRRATAIEQAQLRACAEQDAAAAAELAAQEHQRARELAGQHAAQAQQQAELLAAENAATEAALAAQAAQVALQREGAELAARTADQAARLEALEQARADAGGNWPIPPPPPEAQWSRTAASWPRPSAAPNSAA